MTEFLKGYAAGANDMEAGRLVSDRILTAEEARDAMSCMTYAEQNWSLSTDPPNPIHDSAFAKLSLIANGENDA